MADKEREIWLAEFYRDRYSHLTNLRTNTAQRYVTVIGAFGAIIVVAAKFFSDGNSVLRLSGEHVAGGIFAVFLMGLAVLVYDAMVRKVAKACSECLDGVLLQIMKDSREPRKSTFYFFDEEFFFISQVLIVTTVAGTIALHFHFEKSIWYNQHWFECAIAVFVGLTTLWQLVYIVYPVIDGGKPTSQRWMPPKWFGRTKSLE
jgi:drug/metabolite transporter (DMT)-like permease